MEVKVSVDGVPRVVCGVTEETTCQEVVLVLAQAIGQPGRYVLRESFKDFERCMLPDERLLETLEKYGEQAKEVRLTLQHNAPPAGDETGKAKVGRYQPCQPLRRKDAGARMRRGSGSLILHRQSLPPLSHLRQDADQKQKEPKRPKRKSLTLMEEAWDWLESLGKGKVYSTAGDKESRKRTEKKNRHSLDLSFSLEKDNRDKDKTGLRSDAEPQMTCCVGNQARDKDGKNQRKPHEDRSDQGRSGLATTEDEKNTLRETVIRQLLRLQDLQVQITRTDKQIQELEEKQRAEQGAHERTLHDETEQIKFWENELNAEEGHEKDLQCQFLEMRARAAECKAELEEYKRKMQGLEFFAARDDSGTAPDPGANEISAGSTERLREPASGGAGKACRKFPPRDDPNPPQALVAPNQTRERRLTGPRELREWWARWSEARNSESQTKKKEVHRSELTIYLKSTKV